MLLLVKALTARSKIALLMITALVTVAGSLTLYSTRLGPGRAAVAMFFADPLAIFAARSPGERGKNALFQTKRAYSRPRKHNGDVASNVPSERVLTNVRSRPPVTPQADLPFHLPPIFSGPFVPGEGNPTVPGFDLPFTGPSFGGGNGPGGGGSGVGGGSPPATPAVPEPATWAMMLVGFFSIGAALRNRPRVAVVNQSEIAQSDPT